MKIRNPLSPWRLDSTVIGRPTVPLAIVAASAKDYAVQTEYWRKHTRGGMYRIESEADIKKLRGVYRFVLGETAHATPVTESMLRRYGLSEFRPDDPIASADLK